jgi:hypothetical protein
MPVALAQTLAHGLGDFWPAVAPWIGSLGSFISGSSPFSDMPFTLMQRQIATDLNHSATSILALQSVSAAAGKMGVHPYGRCRMLSIRPTLEALKPRPNIPNHNRTRTPQVSIPAAR